MASMHTIRRIPFTATLRSEWTKLASLRSTWVTLAVGVLLAIGTTVAIAIGTGIDSRDWTEVELATFFYSVETALLGSLFLLIAFVVLGVRMVASEYATGMMHLTLIATPGRAKMLAAKTAILVAITVTVGSIVAIASYFGSLVILDAYGLDGSGASGATRAIASTAVLSCFLPLIGLSLAVLMRSAVGAISTVLGISFLVGALNELFPRVIRENVIVYLPAQASDSVTYSGELAFAVALVAVVGWVFLFLGSATVALTRRDA